MRILTGILVKVVLSFIKNRTKPLIYEIKAGNDYRYQSNPKTNGYLDGVLILPIDFLGIQIQRDNGSIIRLKASEFTLSLNLSKREIHIPKIHFEPDNEYVGNDDGNDTDHDKMMASTLYAYDKNSGFFRDIRESSIGERVINVPPESKGVWEQLRDSVGGWMSYGGSLMGQSVDSEWLNQKKSSTNDIDEQMDTLSSKIEEIIGSPRVIIDDFSISHSIHDETVIATVNAAPFELFFDMELECIKADIQNISIKVIRNSIGNENLFSTNVKKLEFRFDTANKNTNLCLNGVYITSACVLSETFELIEEFLYRLLRPNKEKAKFSIEINDIGVGLKVEKSYLMLKSQYIHLGDSSFWGNLFTMGFKQYGRNNLEQTRKLDVMSVGYVSYLNEHLKIKDVAFNLYGDLYGRMKSFIEPVMKEIDFIGHLIKKTQRIMSIGSNSEKNDYRKRDGVMSKREQSDELLFNMEDITGEPISGITKIPESNGFGLEFDDNYFDLDSDIPIRITGSNTDNDGNDLTISCNMIRIYQWIHDWDKSTDNYVIWKFRDIESVYSESERILISIKDWVIEDYLQNSNWKTFLHFRETNEERKRSLVLNAYFIEEKEKWNLNVFLNDLVLNIDEDTFNFIVQNICSQFGTEWLKGGQIGVNGGIEALDYWEDENEEFDYLGSGKDNCNDWDTLNEYNRDKDRIDFENNGFEFVSGDEGLFNKVELNSFTVILSYRPKYINYGNLVNGRVSELFKLKNIRDLPLRFKAHVIVNEITLNTVLMCWLEDILNLNLNRIVFSGGSLEVLYNIAVNTLNIVKMKKGERGTVRNLGKMATRDFLNLTSRSVMKVQTVMEKLTRKKSAGSSGRSGFSESPSTMKEGLHIGWSSLKDRFGYMVSEEATMKSVIMQPFIGAAEMISKTLIGLENQLDSDKKELRDRRYE